jgi:hypothetical protein
MKPKVEKKKIDHYCLLAGLLLPCLLSGKNDKLRSIIILVTEKEKNRKGDA